MRKSVLLLLSVFLLFLYAGHAELVNNSGELRVKIENNISFGVEKDSDSKIEELKVRTYQFPYTEDPSQSIVDFSTTHNDYSIEKFDQGKYLEFNFEEEDVGRENLIENEFIVDKEKYQPKIKEKHKYSIESGDMYLTFSEMLDQNSKMREKATEIASGEDDVYVIATKVAKWVRDEVNYDLSTLDEEVEQSSTEVFESKRGVCREITNLYVSMMRSLGIPSRVVSGYAYTEHEGVVERVGSRWGPHAWAEVKIGSKWVPFDLTYDQYGYLGAEHIIFTKSKFLEENRGVTINASGYKFSLVEGSLYQDNKFQVVEQKEYGGSLGIDMSVSGPQELGIGSYGYMEVNLENQEDYYKSVLLRLSKIKEVELLGEKERLVTLKPGSEKSVLFKYKVSSQLDSNYRYTFPFTVRTDKESERFQVEVKSSYETLDEEELPSEDNGGISYTQSNLSFSCDMKNGSDTNTITCSITNPNNFRAEGIEVCMDSCESLSLEMGETRTQKFDTQQLNATVGYSWNEKVGESNVSLDKPILEYNRTDYKKGLKLTGKINNYLPKTYLKIFVDKEEVDEISSSEFTNKVEMNEGIHNISLKLYYREKKLSEKNFSFEREKQIEEHSRENVTVVNDDQSSSSEEKNTKSWFRSFIDFIQSIFFG